ncbi:DUF6366 family protein [Planomicrobium okeanokoites]|uniref:DUF6366 family protein n=1 Tax=Planomicrobium okeanokoites TaxID=244 RepID=UPI0030F879FA
MESKKTPEDGRERLRQNELNNNPGGSFRDGMDRGSGIGNLTDSAGGMGWKGTGVLIIVLFFGYVVYSLFFN